MKREPLRAVVVISHSASPLSVGPVSIGTTRIQRPGLHDGGDDPRAELSAEDWHALSVEHRAELRRLADKGLVEIRPTPGDAVLS